MLPISILPMYDTVHLWLDSSNYSDVNGLVNAMINVKVETTYISGNLGNMRVYINEHGISIKGSLAKFYFGENQSSLDRATTKEALSMMSDVTNMPIQNATVSRIDVAANLVTKHKPKAYYSFLGESSSLDRLEQDNGIYYKNKQKKLVFYDKLHEQKITKIPILPIYQNCHLLRYEYCLVKRLKSQLGLTEFTADMLNGEQFYMNMLAKWKQEYFAISRNKILQFKREIMNSSKDFEMQLIQLGLQEIGGQAGAMAMIEQANYENVFENKMQQKRLKDKVKMLSNMPEMVDSDLIQELDKKIIEAVQLYC